jgi:hypothetical protein
MGSNAIKCVGAAVLLAAAGAASAVTISFGGCAAGDGSVLTTCNASATVVNFNSTPVGSLPAGYVGSLGGGQVVQGSVAGSHAAPAGDTSPYLAIPTQGQQGFVTATPGGSHNYFGLYWGSMDSYNTLTFFNGATQIASLTGQDVLAAAAAQGNQTSPDSNRYVNLSFGGLNFTTVVLRSDGVAFESDNHAFGRVPEPATIALLGAAFAGVAFSRRRKQ